MQEELEKCIVVFRSNTREQACESDYTPNERVFVFVCIAKGKGRKAYSGVHTKRIMSAYRHVYKACNRAVKA